MRMKKYRIVHAVVHAGIAALLYLFLGYSDHLSAFAYADYIRAAVLLVLPFLFVQSNVIADILVERVPGLSFGIRRLLSGSDFVEGDWPLVVMNADGVTPKYFGLMTITYKNGQLLIYGDDWNPDGSLAVKFRSQQSQYDARLLQYWYAQGANLNAPAMFGYTRIYFFPDQGRIERQAGEFLDKEHSSQHFFAERVNYGWFGKRLKTKEEKFAAASTFWNRIEPRFKGGAPARVDCDFV
jgi:hypothetical protein